MWVEVERLADEASLTILLTTHYLEEADRLAERVAIVSRGKVVVEGTPEAAEGRPARRVVTIDLADRERAATPLSSCTSSRARRARGRGPALRARVPNGAQAIPVILAALDEQGFPVASVTTSRPSLDDVYLHYTGRDFSTEDSERADPGAPPDRVDGRAAARAT